MATYFLINFGIGAVTGLAFLIIKIATRPKLCDSARGYAKRVAEDSGNMSAEMRMAIPEDLSVSRFIVKIMFRRSFDHETD